MSFGNHCSRIPNSAEVPWAAGVGRVAVVVVPPVETCEGTIDRQGLTLDRTGCYSLLFLSGFFRRDGQVDAERCATSWCGLYGNFSVVRLDNCFDNREP